MEWKGMGAEPAPPFPSTKSKGPRGESQAFAAEVTEAHFRNPRLAGAGFSILSAVGCCERFDTPTHPQHSL